MKQLKILNTRPSRLTMLVFFIGWLLLGLSAALPAQTAFAAGECLSLADMPLEVRGQAAPALVSLAWDASGSMLFTIFTEDDHYYIGNSLYTFVFPESEYHYTSTYNRPLPANMRHHWQTQCADYNRMYYDPAVDYTPWPRWNTLEDHESEFGDFHADINTPRQHPTKSEYGVFDLNAIWYDFVIDNAPGNSVEYLVDQNDAGFSASPALTDSWTEWDNSDYEGGSYHNITLDRKETTAEWEIDVAQAGEYEVMVSVAFNSNRTSQAEYTVDYDGGSYTKTISQYRSSLQQDWESLGVYNFTKTATVTLTCGRENQNYVSVDAVKLIEPRDQIIFAHYFIEDDNGDVFLVNLNDEPTYYQATLSADRKTVDRLTLIDADAAESAGINTDRSYKAERQNFADWYQFYRRRYFTGIAAAGQFIDGWSNVFMRIESFPDKYNNHENFSRQISPLDMTIIDQAGGEDYYDEKDDVLYDLYTMVHPWGGTPLREGLYQTGQFFEFGHGWAALNGQSPFRVYSNTHLFPFFLKKYGGECQQSFAIVMTDGMWNGDLQNSQENIIGNADGDDSTDFDEGAFGDSYDHTTADIAMHFYERDLHPLVPGAAEKHLNNFVPTAEFEDPAANHQRMITYGISFGIPGEYTDEQRVRFSQSLRYGDDPKDADWKGWPKPEPGETSTIDDLWHATINGRGDFFSAANPQKLVEAMEQIKSSIEKRLGSATAVSTNTVQRQVGTLVYQAQFHSSRWSGDLVARSVDADSGTMADDPAWSAKDQLELVAADDRVVLSFGGSDGIPFRYADLSADQKSRLHADSDTGAQIVDFIRGDGSLEQQNAGTFRSRNGKIGDIVHSQPFYHKGVVYVGANDGMLHAFDAQNGEEYFAFVPDRLMDRLAELADEDYSHQYYVDAPPYVRTISKGQSILVGGFGKGGKGFFGLDVTNVKTAAETDAEDVVLWEFPAGTDNDMGYTYARPEIVHTEAEGWVVVAANGYASVNGDAVLYVLNPKTGDLIRKLKTESAGADACNGLSTPVVVDVDLNGNVDYAYAGDLKGNLWKFDLTGDDADNWKVFYNDGADPKPLFTARNADDAVQPITSRPDVMLLSSCGPYLGYLVAFGTGKYFGEDDIFNYETQSFYGIYDWAPAYASMKEPVNDKYLGVFQQDRSLSNASDLTLLEQTVAEDTADWRILTDNTINYYNPLTEEGDHAGWYYDFYDDGERMVAAPQIRNNTVIYVTNTPKADPCVCGGSSILYQVDACSGGRTISPQFDINEDKKFNDSDRISTDDGPLPPTGMKLEGTVYDPTAMPPDILLLTDSLGKITEVLVPPNPPGRCYWRFIE